MLPPKLQALQVLCGVVEPAQTNFIIRSLEVKTADTKNYRRQLRTWTRSHTHVSGANPTTSEVTTTTLCCIRLERFLKVEDNIFVFKTHLGTRGALNFLSAGVVTHGRM
jgi:hypothetical protein